MNKQYTDPFINSFTNVIPQFGISDVELKNIEECGKKIKTPGVVVIIGLVGNLHGNVIFALGEDCAKKIASAMMGMEIEIFDEMAQSAVSELCNMLAANASIELSGTGATVDISTPTLMYGDFTANASYDDLARIEMNADGFPFYIYVSLIEN